MMNNTIVNFSPIAPFNMEINRISSLGADIKSNNHHPPDTCEIYCNLSGNVSYMVENTVYPIEKGSIIITRPFESHHCICHSKELHEYILITFSSKGNESLLDIFFKREKGIKNLIVQTPENFVSFLELCNTFTNEKTTDFQKYYNFFLMIEFLNNSRPQSTVDKKVKKEILSAIEIINKNILETISISYLAEQFNMSIKTFERHFRTGVGMTPTDYVRSRRLALAKIYLSQDYSVNETAQMCGFSNCSLFIASFKKTYGTTPLKFKTQYCKYN